MAKLLPEFPTESHQAAYLEGLEREAQGYRRRMEELEATGLGEGDMAWQQAKEGLDAAERELKRVGGSHQKSAAKRPARARETRKKK